MKTIFVHNATILDCAILFPELGPQGRSWHVDVFWSGKVASDGVLVDFSEAKKLAKQVIDSQFDHRLIVPAECLRSTEGGRSLVSSVWKKDATAGVFVLNCFENALANVEDSVVFSLRAGNLTAFEALLGAAVLDASPSNVAEVKVRLRATEEHCSNYFSYTHSLRLHHGNCQRFHGHSNVIEVLRRGEIDPRASTLAAQFLDGTYLVPSDYVQQKSSGRLCSVEECVRGMGADVAEHVLVGYSGSQGEVALAVPRSVYLCTPSESSIEAIADFVKSTLFANEDVRVVAYEGLQKGAWSS
jgi:6-pyruvoyl-tetrahydropterin synthase